MTPADREKLVEAYDTAKGHYRVCPCDDHRQLYEDARLALLAAMEPVEWEEGWLVNYPGESQATWWTKDPKEYVHPESTVRRVRVSKVEAV